MREKSIYAMLWGIKGISRKNDHTWKQPLATMRPDTMVVIMPEGRMMRAYGLYKDGRPMTVRGGIADIEGCTRRRVRTVFWLKLDTLAFIHTAGAFAILCFIIVHVYMTTTGHTVTAHVKAMVTGWEDVEEGDVQEWEKHGDRSLLPDC